jgi:hypothetical protein
LTDAVLEEESPSEMRMVGLWAALAAATACGRRPVELNVPAAKQAIVIDGELDEKAWPGAARSGPFRDGARQAAPYSDARFLADAKNLYLVLYAADENIQSATDAFDVQLGRMSLRLGPRPRPPAGIVVAVDTDGTIDDPSDDDEEWVIEAAIPLAMLGVAPGDKLDVRLRRCDTPKDGIERCGATSTTLRLPR